MVGRRTERRYQKHHQIVVNAIGHNHLRITVLEQGSAIQAATLLFDLENATLNVLKQMRNCFFDKFACQSEMPICYIKTRLATKHNQEHS